MRRLIMTTAILLAGCDAWPTVADNQTLSPITIRYLHRDYDYWSAPFPIKPGTAIRLARAHWIQDILGIEIRDGKQVYQFRADAMRQLEAACPSSKLSRKLSFAPDCYLVYYGRGRLKLTAKEPEEIKYGQPRNGN